MERHSIRCGKCGLAMLRTSANADGDSGSIGTVIFDKMLEIAQSRANAMYPIPKTDPCYEREWNRNLEVSGNEVQELNSYFQPHGWTWVYTLDCNGGRYEYYFKDENRPLYCKLVVECGYWDDTPKSMTIEKADGNTVKAMTQKDPQTAYSRGSRHRDMSDHDPWDREPRDY